MVVMMMTCIYSAVGWRNHTKLRKGWGEIDCGTVAEKRGLESLLVGDETVYALARSYLDRCDFDIPLDLVE